MVAGGWLKATAGAMYTMILAIPMQSSGIWNRHIYPIMILSNTGQDAKISPISNAMTRRVEQYASFQQRAPVAEKEQGPIA